MNKSIIVALLMNGAHAPLHGMLALLSHKKPTNPHFFTRQRSAASTRITHFLPKSLNQKRPEILEQKNDDLFKDYPYLSYLKDNSLLKQECKRHIEEKNQELPIREDKVRYQNIEEVVQQHIWNCNNQQKDRSLALLNKQLEKASTRGAYVYNDPSQLLRHMFTHPRRISLSNCFRNFPIGTTMLTPHMTLLPFTINTFATTSFMDSELPAGLLFLHLFFAITSAIVSSETMSIRESIDTLVNSRIGNAQQKEFEQYQTIANKIAKKCEIKNIREQLRP